MDTPEDDVERQLRSSELLGYQLAVAHLEAFTGLPIDPSTTGLPVDRRRFGGSV